MPLSAQWKLTASNVILPIFRPNYSGGVIANHNGILWAGYHDIWMSADTGKTWSLRTPFNTFNNSAINDFAFFDDNILLATTQHGEVYITKNQGLSWKAYGPFPPTPFGPSIESACFSVSSNTIIACSDVGDRYISNDGGATWVVTIADSLAHKVQSGSGGNVYLTGGFSTGAWLYETNDLSANWNQEPGIFKWDSYTFARDECDTTIFYVANDDLVAKSDKFSRMFVSTNTGSSWTAYDMQPLPYYCGSVSAASHAVFAQTFYGINRSTDKGKTWQNIGGPPNIIDTRFVTALDNNVVVAVDSFGSVWVTNNSGGDSLVYTDGNTLAIQTADQKTDTIGGTVAVPVSMNGIVTPIDVRLTIHYDADLQYEGTYSIDNVKLDIPGESWTGRSKIFLPGANSSGILAYSYFDVFNDTSKIHSVTFDSLIYCQKYLPVTAISIITPSSTCGANILSQYMRDSTLPQLRIVPNPASTEVSVISSADLGETAVTIFDMLGIKQSELQMEIAKDTPAKLALPLPNGIYDLHLVTSSASYDLRVLIRK